MTEIRRVSTGLPIVGRCRKCGREFVGLGKSRPLIDRFMPQGLPSRLYSDPNTELCLGEIEVFQEALEISEKESAAFWKKFKSTNVFDGVKLLSTDDREKRLARVRRDEAKAPSPVSQIGRG